MANHWNGVFDLHEKKKKQLEIKTKMEQKKNNHWLSFNWLSTKMIILIWYWGEQQLVKELLVEDNYLWNVARFSILFWRFRGFLFSLSRNTSTRCSGEWFTKCCPNTKLVNIYSSTFLYDGSANWDGSFFISFYFFSTGASWLELNNHKWNAIELFYSMEKPHCSSGK